MKTLACGCVLTLVMLFVVPVAPSQSVPDIPSLPPTAVPTVPTVPQVPDVPTSPTIPDIPNVSVPSGGAPPIPPGYFYRPAIPAACLIGDKITGADACDVVDAYQLEQDFRNALNSGDAAKRLERLVLEEGAKKVLLMGFPREWQFDRKVDIVQKVYAEQGRLVAAVQTQIIRTMTEDPAVANRLHQYANLDSQGVQSMSRRAHDEQRENIDRAKKYLESNPHSDGVSFNCALSCKQAIAAGKGLNVFDNR